MKKCKESWDLKCDICGKGVTDFGSKKSLDSFLKGSNGWSQTWIGWDLCPECSENLQFEEQMLTWKGERMKLSEFVLKQNL